MELDPCLTCSTFLLLALPTKDDTGGAVFIITCSEIVHIKVVAVTMVQKKVCFCFLKSKMFSDVIFDVHLCNSPLEY